MRKIVPSIACATVVFTHGAPLPFTQVGAPLFPGNITLPCFLQSQLFRVIGCSYHALRSFLDVTPLPSAWQGVALASFKHHAARGQSLWQWRLVRLAPEQ